MEINETPPSPEFDGAFCCGRGKFRVLSVFSRTVACCSGFDVQHLARKADDGTASTDQRPVLPNRLASGTAGAPATGISAADRAVGVFHRRGRITDRDSPFKAEQASVASA